MVLAPEHALVASLTTADQRADLVFGADGRNPPGPDRQALDELHHKAHELCFIANSIRTEIIVEIVA